MTKYFIGIVGSLAGALAGAWLILAPFALGYQPDGADWIDATKVDFFTGIVILLVSLAGAVAYALALREELKSRGIIESEAAYTARTAGAPAGGYAARQGELERVLLPLATAMLEDMREQREKDPASNGQPDSERKVRQ